MTTSNYLLVVTVAVALMLTCVPRFHAKGIDLPGVTLPEEVYRTTTTERDDLLYWCRAELLTLYTNLTITYADKAYSPRGAKIYARRENGGNFKEIAKLGADWANSNSTVTINLTHFLGKDLAKVDFAIKQGEKWMEEGYRYVKELNIFNARVS